MGNEHFSEHLRPATVPHSVPDCDVMTVGAGCFWCADSVFRHIKGVKKVISGYAGGYTDNPSYEDVCTGLTNHAEVVRVWFNPDQVSFKRLLEIFFRIHNPTQLNRQGNDRGTHYRSTIMYHTHEQADIAVE